MFENKTLLELIRMGGWVMYVLAACSFVSVAVFVGKELEFWRRSLPSQRKVMKRIRDLMHGDGIEQALSYCRKSPFNAYCAISAAGLAQAAQDPLEIEEALSREITYQIGKLERLTIIVGTIANIAVYIGLFGTVLGIVKAFHSMSVTGTAGLSVVIGGVAEALLNTAAGLGVAIPAVVFYNLLMKQIKHITNMMDSTAGEVLIMLKLRKERGRAEAAQ